MLNLEALDALGLGEAAPAVSADVPLLLATPQHSTEGMFLGGVGSSSIFGGSAAPRERWASSF